MGRRPPLSPSVCRLEIYQISIEQKNTLANVFLIITKPIHRLAPHNSLPTISGKTKCKVTHFFGKHKAMAYEICLEQSLSFVNDNLIMTI